MPDTAPSLLSRFFLPGLAVLTILGIVVITALSSREAKPPITKSAPSTPPTQSSAAANRSTDPPATPAVAVQAMVNVAPMVTPSTSPRVVVAASQPAAAQPKQTSTVDGGALIDPPSGDGALAPGERAVARPQPPGRISNLMTTAISKTDVQLTRNAAPDRGSNPRPDNDVELRL